ncbi:MAG TPA: D-arabinono-1,4-lactone oxidase [Acidimicrobiales bacterium]|jgi:FAD/FMN-containing dehydrogenase|nr:D-arabinono-1,4-lactone oxidase [Acidimicrobiales bacterium]
MPFLSSRWDPPLRSPRDRRDRFVNYSGAVVRAPAGWDAPADEADTAKAVIAAAAAGRRIRVVGAGHSWSPIAAPDDRAMTLDQVKGIVARGPGWVRVRAGTRVRELNQALAAAGEALPIQSSITHQSVAGAVATATHGSSLVHGNLSSLVLGARLVVGDGTTVEVAGDDPRLDAVRVHLGALGIITELTLRTEPAFRLAESIEAIPLHRVAAQVEDISASAEYVKIWWMPHTADVLVFRYERTEEETTGWPSPQLHRLVEMWVPKVVLPPVLAWHRRRPDAVPAFNRIALRQLSKKRRVGPSDLMLTGPDPFRHYETEAAVPLAAGGEAFDRTVRLIERLGVRANFILELRFGRHDRAWLSPAHDRDVVNLGACTAVTRHREPYFRAFWEEMGPLGGRPHWAKEMDHDAVELRSLYPQMDRFVALRNELDPGRVFSNRFLDRVLGE